MDIFSDETFIREAEQFGKSLTLAAAVRAAAVRAAAENTMLFIGTPNGCKAIKADPKAAERAKRYIWSRIERNDTSRRAGK